MPTCVHGARSAARSAADSRRIPKPSRRRSTIAIVPIDNAKPMKCRLCITGKTHSYLLMAWDQGLFTSHLKNSTVMVLGSVHHGKSQLHKFISVGKGSNGSNPR